MCYMNFPSPYVFLSVLVLWNDKCQLDVSVHTCID